MIDRDLPIAKEACLEIRECVKLELGVPEDEVSEVTAWGCDVTDTDQVRETISEIGKKFGGVIDIFVGAAGSGSPLLTAPRFLLLTHVCSSKG